MYDREKQHLWTIFAAAGLSAGLKVEGAARNADEMTDQFEKRFPAEKDEDDK
jgi:methyl coenzyme M reductase beta subunit